MLLNRPPPPYPEQLTVALFGKKIQLKNIIGNVILNHPDAFNSISQKLDFEENTSFKVISAPDFFDEDCLYPDQGIIDFMAVSHPGPHLFILTVDSENTQEEKVMAQIKKLQDTFGEEITEHLVVFLPDIESFHSLTRLKEQFKVQMATNENLASDCRRWCSGCQSFLYDYKNYSQEVVLRRRKEIEKRRCKDHPLCYHGRAGADTVCSLPSQHVVVAPASNAYEHYTGADTVCSLPSQHVVVAPASNAYKHYTGSRTYIQSNGICNIVLLGPTGAGKSACANTIFAAGTEQESRQLFKSMASSMPVTTKCEVRTINNLFGMHVRLVDTPDFLQPEPKSSQEELEECKKYCRQGQCVVLLVLQLGWLTTDVEEGLLEKLEQKLGWRIRESTIVLMTHGDDLKGNLEQFIKKCVPLRNIIDLCSGHYHIFNNFSKDVKQVKELVKKIRNSEKRSVKHKKDDCFLS